MDDIIFFYKVHGFLALILIYPAPTVLIKKIKYQLYPGIAIVKKSWVFFILEKKKSEVNVQINPAVLIFRNYPFVFHGK